MTSSRAKRVAIDIGGTFTDVVLAGPGNKILATVKVPTTPTDPTDGALNGVQQVLDSADAGIEEITGFIHGTTLATNALIERRGATVCAVLTEGFRDILEIGYERRYSQYDIDIEKPDLIVPRERCFTIPERISAGGEVLAALDEGSIDDLVAKIDDSGADAVAICLLHAYANDRHERRLRDLLLARRPGLSVSLSSEVSPEAREYDRLCTTVANAYIQPLMAGYLAALERRFADAGLACPILMMTASGGMTALDNAARFPIRLVESGPAGGAILAAQAAASCGLEKVLSFDMGGTTAKLCLIDGFTPQTARQFEISRAARFIKGSGLPARIPVIEMIEIGAGGGSIAAVDGLGRLSVGPKSAGSEPGPAAFGKGGTQSTVTDADVVLGVIVPETFAEGRLQVDLDAAAAAVVEHVGDPLSLGCDEAADGISQIVDESMAGAGRMHAVESGKDLGHRTMIAFGGNGPLHATRMARRAGVERILVPRDPGVGSAVGFLFAPISFEVARSRYTELETADLDAINRLLTETVAEAEAVVRMGAPDGPLDVRKSAFMRYRGQGHEIDVTLPANALTPEDIEVLRNRFEAEYRRLFVRAVPGMTIEILNWLVTVSTPDASPDPIPACAGAGDAEPEGSRSIFCDLTGRRRKALLYRRDTLKSGQQLHGPALVVEAQTTTMISADFDATVDAAGNLILTRNSAQGAGL